MPEMEVRIVRSGARVRTVSARVVNDVLEVRAPAAMTDAELQPIIERLRARLARKRERKQARRSLEDEQLQQRAEALNRRYFDGRLTWTSIGWVTNQQSRWGSCTPSTGTIRISHRLAALPEWVLDTVIVHELAHLLEANHGARFWTLVNRYPLAERGRGYLMAISAEAEESM